MKIGVLQMTSGLDPAANAQTIETAVADAAAGGAVMLFTPEMSGLLDSDGARADANIVHEDQDEVLRRVRTAARRHGLWVHLGSLAVRDPDSAKWANRAFVINAEGGVAARYDKMHLFDVDLHTGESWHESARYVPGRGPVVVETLVGMLGLSICYDMRFPALYQALSAAGATVIAAPAAFTVPTGKAHWHVLLRARAIENAAFVVAAAQVGVHADGRATFGHSLVVDPWGQVLLDMGEKPGLQYCEIDLAMIDEVRGRIPVVRHRRAIPQMAHA